jgi:hypothetical protein
MAALPQAAAGKVPEIRVPYPQKLWTSLWKDAFAGLPFPGQIAFLLL